MKIIVIGGSGFLGKHVVADLISNRHEITIFDLNIENEEDKRFKYIKGDIKNYDNVLNATKGHDVVMHLGAISDIDECDSNPLEASQVNIIGTVNILQSCIENSINKILFASTVYVSGHSGGIYRCTKEASENLIREYSKKNDLNYIILRYGSLYGPGSDQRNGLYRIISNALRDGFVSYEGDDNTTREYIQVSDAAKSTNAILFGDLNNSTIVITGQQSIKVKDLLKTISEIMGYEKEVKFISKKQSGHYIRTPSSYIKEYPRKYIPKLHIDLGEGLVDLIDYVKKINN
tara:strand:+ start:83 stop:952 length:870 start_codon:yes stop_codon:yes gene_type:complete